MRKFLIILFLLSLQGFAYSQEATDTTDYNPEKLMLLGDEYRNQFEYSKALFYYNSLLKRDSLNLKAMEYASDMYSLLGEFGSSVKLLRKLNSIDTANIRIINKLALSLQSQQQPREAANIYRKLIKLSNANFNTTKNLADCYWLLGKRDSAEVYYKVADFINGKSLITKLNLSQIAYLNKDFSSSRIFASRGVDLDSTYVPLRKQLGMVLYRMEEYKQALNNFNFLIEKGDSSANILKYAGACNFFMGEFKSSIPLLRATLELDSTDTEAMFYLGSSLSYNGEAEEASNIFNYLITLLQPDPDLLYKIYNQLGIAYSSLDKNRESYNYFAEAFKYNPADIKLLFQMAMVKGGVKEKGSMEMAKKLLEQYLEALNPKGSNLSPEEIILRERAKIYIEQINEDLFMSE